MKEHAHTFESELWVYPGEVASWYFVTVPRGLSETIKAISGKRKGWGSVRVSVTVGAVQWATSVFPESKSGSYILPIKAEVRRKASLRAGDNVSVTLQLVS